MPKFWKSVAEIYAPIFDQLERAAENFQQNAAENVQQNAGVNVQRSVFWQNAAAIVKPLKKIHENQKNGEK